MSQILPPGHDGNETNLKIRLNIVLGAIRQPEKKLALGLLDVLLHDSSLTFPITTSVKAE